MARIIHERVLPPGQKIAGIDYMSDDITRPFRTRGLVDEVNSCPGWEPSWGSPGCPWATIHAVLDAQQSECTHSRA